MHTTLAGDGFSEGLVAFWGSVLKILTGFSSGRWLVQERNIFFLTSICFLVICFFHFNESWNYPGKAEVALTSSSKQLPCPVTELYLSGCDQQEPKQQFSQGGSSGFLREPSCYFIAQDAVQKLKAFLNLLKLAPWKMTADLKKNFFFENKLIYPYSKDATFFSSR